MRLISIFGIRARQRVRRYSMVGLGVITPVLARGQQSCQAEGKLMPVKGLPEASGVAVSRKSTDVLWSHNDSGEPVLIAVGTDGEPRGRVWIAGAAVEDWEDIEAGPCPGGSCIYIGDIGDNNAKRGSLTIYPAAAAARLAAGDAIGVQRRRSCRALGTARAHRRRAARLRRLA